MVGIEVCDVQAFIERECGMVDVDLLRPSWMVFSDGFVLNVWRSMTKRGFDVLASLMLLLFTFLGNKASASFVEQCICC